MDGKWLGGQPVETTYKCDILMEEKNKNKVLHRLLTGRKKVIRKGDLKYLPVSEKRIQMECVAEFQKLYPSIASKGLLFHVPNECAGKRFDTLKTKANGLCVGVSDLILLVPRKGYGALCIEIKTPTGTQSVAQKQWQKNVSEVGQKYVVCHTVEEFAKEVNRYLKG